ncbi:MAG: PilN domain-containing protein [Candidatus Omnitrophica bacterium]|jgi:Tfp pilus assembly protein PilN|nr:PilN domain-containing protein [Candidatus Omnitrophota bacterium]MDD5080299.1 PilN domain-containing protein [Candidatus Omnitrophota bacterium]
MIEINLLPDEMKAKGSGSNGQLDQFLYLIPLLAGALILAHAYLGLVQFTRSLSLSSLNKKWSVLAPQREKITAVKNAGESASRQEDLIRGLGAKSVDWARLQNKLSLDLPNGVWFNEISLSAKELTIRGTVVSLEKNEVDLINKFMSNLKQDRDIIGDFKSLELSSVQRKNIGTFEVADFILVAALKEK